MFGVWDSYGLSAFNFKSGSFNENSPGRWYFNIVVEDPKVPSTGTGEFGRDLDSKTRATCSVGTELTRKPF